MCYVNSIHAVFKSFRCLNCETAFNRTFNLERHLIACSEQLKNVYPKNVYQTQENMFDKPKCFGIENTNEQTLFKNLVLFVFESICVEKESFKNTVTSKWMGKHALMLVSIFSKLENEPIFFCNSDPHHLVTSFIGAVETLALQSKAILKKLVFDVKTTV